MFQNLIAISYFNQATFLHNGYAVGQDIDNRKVVAESVTAVTGDKKVPELPKQDTEDNNVIELKRLAGL